MPEGTSRPDPRIRMHAQLRRMPVPVFGLVPQPHVEDPDMVGFGCGENDGGMYEATADITYTLWRNPDDREDPANLVGPAKLAEVREQLDLVPPGRPAWIRDMVRRMRYPMLWNAVRTTWAREPSDRMTLAQTLVAHTDHVLRQRYDDDPWPVPPAAAPASVTPAGSITVDGAPVDAVHLDIDPRVYAVGVQLAPTHLITAVLPREALPLLIVAFATRPVTH